jgi:hypothetical protein
MIIKHTGISLPPLMPQLCRIQPADPRGLTPRLVHEVACSAWTIATLAIDVAPNSYPLATGVWRSNLPIWAVIAAGCGAEPSV